MIRVRGNVPFSSGRQTLPYDSPIPFPQSISGDAPCEETEGVEWNISRLPHTEQFILYTSFLKKHVK